MYEFPSGDAVPSGSPNNTTPEPAHCHIPLCVRVAGLYFGIRIFGDGDARGAGRERPYGDLGSRPLPPACRATPLPCPSMRFACSAISHRLAGRELVLAPLLGDLAGSMPYGTHTHPCPPCGARFAVLNAVSRSPRRTQARFPGRTLTLTRGVPSEVWRGGGSKITLKDCGNGTSGVPVTGTLVVIGKPFAPARRAHVD